MRRVACVTGAAGFIGSHLVRELLEHGHVVRAAVRDHRDVGRTGHLTALAAALGATDRLSLHSVDLGQPGALDPVVAGSDWVCHLAAVMASRGKDPAVAITEAAMTSTRNTLEAVARSPSVTSLAVTSSITAVVSERARPGHVFTEDDWFDGQDPATHAYAVGKTSSERAVWDFAGNVGAGRGLRTLVVNPTLVVGPPLCAAHRGSSLQVIEDLMTGRYFGAPPYGVGIVHVADVATILRLGLEQGIDGRFILSAGDLWMKDILQLIRAELPGRRIPGHSAPAFLRFVAATVRRRGLAGLRDQLGRLDRVSAEKARRAFGVTFRTPETSVRDCIRAL